MLFAFTFIFLFHYVADGFKNGPPPLEFSKLEKCDIFMMHVDSSPKLSIVQACSIDSVAFHHEDRKVCLGVLKDAHVTVLKGELRNRDNLEIVYVDPDFLFSEDPLNHIWEQWRENVETTAFKNQHLSRLLGMAWLWKYGGMVLDTDLLILKPIYGLNSSYLVIENTDPGRGISSGVVKLSRHHPFLNSLLGFFYINYDPTNRNEWSNEDFTETLSEYCSEEIEAGGGREPGEKANYIYRRIGKSKSYDCMDCKKRREDDLTVLIGQRCKDNLRIFPTKQFFPLKAKEWGKIFAEDFTEERVFLAYDEKDSGVHAIKLWNVYSSLIQVEDLRNGTGFVTLSEDHCSNIFHRNIKQTIENRWTKKITFGVPGCPVEHITVEREH
ncbi:alpha-1,4-N-acetylglucosaminyltransferase [Eurytemora carolleeae]|uniref:alpha-1,4-N-acetylglucosaminyltransferase n=1 Tax=Eurytemora carolleeae TaxID=1294199 RepID=UPI000C76EF8C|nr:alpha-1,4-N-acetylglucosaminyltransferase [Eurytemora carolleeae]|eukprot:XP_023337059.1 alpha-1,4-N-acetylglucosaminyltransferase-like [Eurytemora affinis]